MMSVFAYRIKVRIMNASGDIGLPYILQEVGFLPDLSNRLPIYSRFLTSGMRRGWMTIAWERSGRLVQGV
jgi:hypothetical protein